MKPKKNMLLKLMVCVGLLLAVLVVSASAQDSEATLEQMLMNRAGGADILRFCYGDYDGDGMHEAFALLGDEDEYTGGMTGDIWFVSPSTCKAVQTGCSYLDAQMLGSEAPILFTAEEWYGGSGSTSYIWSVENGAPVEIDISIFGDFQIGQGNEFLAYPSAFDGYTDGTGHTWKPYFFFLDGRTMREYGGLYISMDELMEFDGAREIVDRVAGSSYDITGIIYRMNGRIHVNMTEKGSGLCMNQYVTLRYEGKRAYEEETGMGVYELASNPSVAVYPSRFIHPQGQSTSAGKLPGFNTVSPNQGGTVALPSLSTPRPAQPENNPMPQLPSLNGSSSQGSQSTQGGQSTQGSQKVQATASVNVRAQPNLNGAKLGSITAGESLTYLNESRADNRGVTWYKVQYQGKTGWVSSTYSKLVGSSGGSASQSGGARPNTSQSGSAQSGGKQVRIVGGNANIRSGPGLDYKSVGSLKEGRVVKYMGKTSRDNRGVDWYYIDFNGTIGWVSSKYAKLY